MTRVTPYQIIRRLAKMGSSIALTPQKRPHLPPVVDKTWFAPAGQHSGKLEEGVCRPLCGLSRGKLVWILLPPDLSPEQARAIEHQSREFGFCLKCLRKYGQIMNVEVNADYTMR